MPRFTQVYWPQAQPRLPPWSTVSKEYRFDSASHRRELRIGDHGIIFYHSDHHNSQFIFADIDKDSEWFVTADASPEQSPAGSVTAAGSSWA